MSFGNLFRNAVTTMGNHMPSMSTLGNIAGRAAGYALPAIGSAIGNRMNGQAGASMGSNLANIAAANQFGSPLTANVHDTFNQAGNMIGNQAKTALNAQLGQHLSPAMQQTAMNTPLNRMGPALGQQYGQQMAQDLPAFARPIGSWAAGNIGRGVGHLGQAVANRFMPDSYSTYSPSQLAGNTGEYARQQAFNHLSPELQNQANFQQLPFSGGGTGYANGGYAMGGGLPSTQYNPMSMMPGNDNSQNGYNQYPSLYNNNPGMHQNYANGGYAMGGYSPIENSGYYSPESLDMGMNNPPYKHSLREIADMRAYG